jgi:hypothetical protein
MFFQSRDMDPGLIELFVDGKEDALPDSGRLDMLGLGSGSVVFMLQRLGWRWETCGGDIALSGEGLVATMATMAGEASAGLVTGGSPMTEGRHYWEVEVASDHDYVGFTVGAARPCIDHGQDIASGTKGAYCIAGFSGGLWGDGISPVSQKRKWERKFAMGDRIGVLLDLDAGWLRFYRNGKRYGPGFTEGVTGPLVRVVGLGELGDQVTALPAAVAPEGAGVADEPWE